MADAYVFGDELKKAGVENMSLLYSVLHRVLQLYYLILFQLRHRD